MPDDSELAPKNHLLRWENAGMRVPGSVIRLDLYRLVCYFHASEYLSGLSDMGDFCPWQSLRDDFEASEVVRIILQTAVMARFIAFGHADAERSQTEGLNEKVGDLFKQTDQLRAEALSLREACNKIIHAHNLVLDSNGSGNPYRRFIKPRILCYEDFEKQRGWRAELDVLAFVEICSQLAVSFS